MDGSRRHAFLGVIYSHLQGHESDSAVAPQEGESDDAEYRDESGDPYVSPDMPETED